MQTTSPLPQDVWDRTPAEAQASIRALEARVAALAAPVPRLLERLRMDAQHASPPPSRAAPTPRRPRQRRTPSGRKPGGQPGPHGQRRAWVPREHGEAVLPVKPTPCVRCRHPWSGAAGQPQRPQGTALPPGHPVVPAYQLPSLVCPACGAAPRAALPRGVSPGGCGPRVQSAVALCTGAYRLAKRTPQEVMAALWGMAMRLGTIAPLEQATVQAMATPVAEAHASVRTPPVAPLDETGWREGCTRAWWWVAVTTGGTVVAGRLSRGAKVAQEMWGARCGGLLVTDRWRADTWYPPVAARLRGASAAGLCSPDRTRGALPRDWRSPASAGPPNVSLVAWCP